MNAQNEIPDCSMTNEQLLRGLEKLVKSERKLMHVILSHIHGVEVRKLHLDLGYDSIFKFLTVHHGYSEDAAYARMQGARLLAQVPALKQKLEVGSISLTQVSKVCSAIRSERKSGKIVSTEKTLALLEMIEHKNLQETRRIIAIELDQPVVQAQSVKPQKDESFLLQATLTKAQFEAFRKAQSLISHSVTDNSIADAIEYLSNFLIKKIEGKAKAVVKTVKSEGCLKREERFPNEGASASAEEHKKTTQSFRIIRQKRKYLSVKIRRRLMAESGGHCTFLHPETGIRCDSSYQLQTDHIVPVSEGGSEDVSNLRMMCGIHNRDRNRLPNRFQSGRSTNEIKW